MHAMAKENALVRAPTGASKNDIYGQLMSARKTAKRTRMAAKAQTDQLLDAGISYGAGLAMGYYFSENPESERIGKSEDDPTSKGIDSKLVVGLGAVAYAAFGNAGGAGRYLETVGHAALALAGADAGVEMSKDSDG